MPIPISGYTGKLLLWIDALTLGTFWFHSDHMESERGGEERREVKEEEERWRTSGEGEDQGGSGGKGRG